MYRKNVIFHQSKEVLHNQMEGGVTSHQLLKVTSQQSLLIHSI